MNESHLEEIRLSRILANAIYDAIKCGDSDIPEPVRYALKNLQKLYDKQIENGEM